MITNYNTKEKLLHLDAVNQFDETFESQKSQLGIVNS